MSKPYQELKTYMDKAMAIKTAMTLFEWDNETLAPKEAGELTSQVIGVLSGEYFEAVTCDGMKKLLKECREQGGLTEAEAPTCGSCQRNWSRPSASPRRSTRNLPV